jgi:hypothetical protein
MWLWSCSTLWTADVATTALRQRHIEDLQPRSLSARTRDSDVHGVWRLAEHHGKPGGCTSAAPSPSRVSCPATSMAGSGALSYDRLADVPTHHEDLPPWKGSPPPTARRLWQHPDQDLRDERHRLTPEPTLTGKRTCPIASWQQERLRHRNRCRIPSFLGPAGVVQWSESRRPCPHPWRATSWHTHLWACLPKPNACASMREWVVIGGPPHEPTCRRDP